MYPRVKERVPLPYTHSLNCTATMWLESDLDIDSFIQLREFLNTCSIFSLIMWMLPFQYTLWNWVCAVCISVLHNWGNSFFFFFFEVIAKSMKALGFASRASTHKEFWKYFIISPGQFCEIKTVFPFFFEEMVWKEGYKKMCVYMSTCVYAHANIYTHIKSCNWLSSDIAITEVDTRMKPTGFDHY